MKTSENNINEYFDFLGLWNLTSKCGLKIIVNKQQKIVIVTELYKNNPGTSVTDVSASLAMQICNSYNINIHDFIYIECCPEMNSKLNFYSERYFLVTFDIVDDKLLNPVYKELEKDVFDKIVCL